MDCVTLLFCKCRSAWRGKLFIVLSSCYVPWKYIFRPPSLVMIPTGWADHLSSIFQQQIRWTPFLPSFNVFVMFSKAISSECKYSSVSCSCMLKGQILLYSDLINKSCREWISPGNKGIQMLYITLNHSTRWKRIQTTLTIKAKTWKPPTFLKYHTEIIPWQWSTVLTATT